VAQVTGSFVLAGVQLGTRDPSVVVKVIGIPVLFVASVATTLMVRSMERRGRDALPTTLALEALLLTGLLASWLVGGPSWQPNTPAVVSASMFGLSAMGVQGALVRVLVQGSPSTNVMTLNTTQFAIDMADFVLAWWPLRRASAAPTAAAEYADLKRGLSKLCPAMLGFFSARWQAPPPMFGSVCGAWCSLLRSLLCCWSGLQHSTELE
jgi:hypothetical protein